MKTTTAIMAVMLLGAAGAEAADIQGKWGIGAGVFDGRGEASLIRGKSVAAHSRLASFTWLHTTVRRSDSSGTLRASGHSEAATIGLAPTIYVRGYF